MTDDDRLELIHKICVLPPDDYHGHLIERILNDALAAVLRQRKERTDVRATLDRGETIVIGPSVSISGSSCRRLMSIGYFPPRSAVFPHFD